MSRKSARIVKKQPPAPRSLEEISKEYQQCCVEVGHTQYQISVLKDELESLYEQMFELNKEGAARRQLDAESAAKPQVEGESNGQV